jgi:phosphate transporter
VLSSAVEESGILAVAATAIERHTHGLGLWQITAVFCALVLLCTTFVSHTVGAMVILPVVASVGAHLKDPHPQLLVMATALVCSCAMGLPVSGARPAARACAFLRL